MTELFEYLLIALACPLVLPIVEPQAESEGKGMTVDEINRIKYMVCCPMCDNEKCVRKTDKCEAEIWAKSKVESEDKKGDTAKLSSDGPLLVDQYNHIEGKKVPLIHTDKEKRLIEEANQRIRKSQVEQAKGAIRSVNFIAK